jgi:SpoVK/Ycf46/Vps4 family AAA+-type ATPase
MLKSLDRFKGIIIGSLNVIDENRLESAGIRRFETLVNFSLPSREARKSIWASREGFWQGNDALLERLSGFELSGSDIHSICSRGFFLQFAGEDFAEETLFELIAEQEVLAAKTRYQKSAASTIGFQKMAG